MDLCIVILGNSKDVTYTSLLSQFKVLEYSFTLQVNHRQRFMQKKIDIHDGMKMKVINLMHKDEPTVVYVTKPILIVNLNTES